MNQDLNIDDIVGKIETIRNSLKISDEIIPMLSNMFSFMADMLPLMASIKYSLKNTTDELPTASDNISSVSQTTELATHQVLDKLDGILDKLELLPAELKNQETTSPGMRMIFDMKEESTDIINALQFQDITSQQLEHSVTILDAVYQKFISLFDRISTVAPENEFVDGAIKNIETKYQKQYQQDLQEFKQKTEDKIRNKGISQNEIDDLFK